MSIQIPTTIALGSVTGKNIAVPYRWTFATATARAVSTDNLTGVSYVSTDIGKLALQSNDNSLWMLTAITPTWIPVFSNPNIVRRSATSSLSALSGSLAIFDQGPSSNFTLPSAPVAGWNVMGVSTISGASTFVCSSPDIIEPDFGQSGNTAISITGLGSIKLIYDGAGHWVPVSNVGPWTPGS